MTVGRLTVDDNGAIDVADETKTTDAVGIPYDG